MNPSSPRPTITELRLAAFKSHRGARFALGPLTLLAGGGGSGKSSALEALAVLARLAGGEELGGAFDGVVRGGAPACAPLGTRPDNQRRRGFRIGCTVDGPVGAVRLDVAVQTEPEPRVVGERLTGAGRTLLTTALRDPARRAVQAAWHTGGAVQVTRAPLPDDRLATALLPLRVAGTTDGQRLVLAAAEQVVIALRAVFPVDPQPWRMREPARLGDGLLRGGCDNLSAVLFRTQDECRTRHAALVGAARVACAGPVDGLVAARQDGRDSVLAAVDRGPLGSTPLDRLGDSELRFLALGLVLLTGPGVLEMDQSAEVPPALRAMTVLADGLDSGLDRRQTAELLSLAARAARGGHVRLLGTVHDADPFEGAELVSVIRLRRADEGGARVPQQRGEARRGASEVAACRDGE
jgi:energy-coupling factor transporter ATP-binding protein EcfA2